VALVWANSPWRSAYDSLLHTAVGIRIGSLGLRARRALLITDGLMVVFFVVGLEIKRELHAGEHDAGPPSAVAALGGMLFRRASTFSHPYSRRAGALGHMATDIARCRDPRASASACRPLGDPLLALAVIDDPGRLSSSR
jgi:NhaA family Na+:H+ antiporter